VINCSGCTCFQEQNLYWAVVIKRGVTDPDDMDDTELDYFYFPGCCKCINNWRIDTTLELTSEAPTKAIKHVTSKISCARSQQYTKNQSFYWLNEVVGNDNSKFPALIGPKVISDGPTNGLSIRQLKWLLVFTELRPCLVSKLKPPLYRYVIIQTVVWSTGGCIPIF